VGVFRAGQWLLDFSGTNSVTGTYQYGQAGDIPVVGDWRGSGITNQIGVYRNGLWILNIPANNRLAGYEQYQMYLTFGGGSYTPLVY
jgi:serine-aspartate repeat-containing protein C/D/E